MQGFIKDAIHRTYYGAKPKICMSIADWAGLHKIPAIDIHPPILPELKEYLIEDNRLEQHVWGCKDILSRSQVLVRIEQVTVRDTLGLVQLPDGQVCFEGNWWLPYLQEHPVYRRRFAKRSRYIKGDVYSLLCLWGQEFYHWFHDVLPRLEYSIPYLPTNTKFLIQDQPRSYQLDSLLAYGIDSDRLEFQSVGLDTKVERLWFASPIGHTGLGSAKALKKVRKRLLEYFNVQVDLHPMQRIYVSRRRAATRRVVNESQLEPVLRDYGFEIYTVEDLPLFKQIELFSCAEAVAGPHGAGLTNILYAPTGVQVAEIAHFSGFSHYIVLSKQLGHHFTRLRALPLEGNQADDMEADSQQLIRWLDTLSV